MVHWWLMVLLFLVVAVAANALALLPTHCAPSFLRLSHFGLRATFCVCHLDLERSPCSSQLLPKLDLEHLVCCIAINSPGNVEGALLAAFGYLILCPPCESTAVGQHSRSNKIIQIASYLRLQKLYYNYSFYFYYIAHPQIPQPSNHLVCQGTRTLERGWEVRTMGITTPGPGSQQGSLYRWQGGWNNFFILICLLCCQKIKDDKKSH